jgi:hypothetical protein
MTLLNNLLKRFREYPTILGSMTFGGFAIIIIGGTIHNDTLILVGVLELLATPFAASWLDAEKRPISTFSQDRHQEKQD